MQAIRDDSGPLRIEADRLEPEVVNEVFFNTCANRPMAV
jgi:hypothetical protein